MSEQQLVKKNNGSGYSKVTPITSLEGVIDNGRTLSEILKGFNMYFLAFTGDKESTRLLVPLTLRRKGLWITYVMYDGSIINEWYVGNSVDDNSFKSDENWRMNMSVYSEADINSRISMQNTIKALERRVTALEAEKK